MDQIPLDFGNLPKPIMAALAITLICRALKAIPWIKDWLIPWFALVIGMVLYPTIVGSCDANNVVVGLIIGGVTVGLYTTAKQTLVTRTEESGKTPGPMVRVMFGMFGMKPDGNLEVEDVGVKDDVGVRVKKPDDVGVKWDFDR